MKESIRKVVPGLPDWWIVDKHDGRPVVQHTASHDHCVATWFSNLRSNHRVPKVSGGKRTHHHK